MKPTPHPSKGKKDDQTETDGGAGGVVKAEYRERYGKDKHCGDDVAKAFKEALTAPSKDKPAPETLESIAKANGVDLDKWSALNRGLQRMNLGNALRGLHRNGTDVKIGAKTIKGAPQTEKKKKEDKKAA